MVHFVIIEFLTNVMESTLDNKNQCMKVYICFVILIKYYYKYRSLWSFTNIALEGAVQKLSQKESIP